MQNTTLLLVICDTNNVKYSLKTRIRVGGGCRLHEVTDVEVEVGQVVALKAGSDFVTERETHEGDLQATSSNQRQDEVGSASRGAKSAARIRAESQVEVLKRRLGTLEQIRAELGLSRRQISQLLLVDPSAWSRWTAPGNDAPPLVYRALAWYLAVEDKYPALDVSFWLQALPAKAHLEEIEWERLRARVLELEQETARLREAQALRESAKDTKDANEQPDGSAANRSKKRSRKRGASSEVSVAGPPEAAGVSFIGRLARAVWRGRG